MSWNASFYPQPILNWRRRSTLGTSIDFPFLNVIGFLCYTITTGTFLYSPTIRAQYAVRHPKSPEPTTRLNDFIFGAHSAVMVVVCYSQYFPSIWGFQIPRSQRVSRPVSMIAFGCASMVIVVTCLMLLYNGVQDQNATIWAWIDVVYALGNVKLTVTVVKYVPQVVMNYQRKSTAGFSIGTILFDLVGGVLSLTQLLMDSSLQGDWSGITGNPVKLGLSNISICFDIIFMVQHYILYRKQHESELETGKGEHTPLLQPSS